MFRNKCSPATIDAAEIASYADYTGVQLFPGALVTKDASSGVSEDAPVVAFPPGRRKTLYACPFVGQEGRMSADMTLPGPLFVLGQARKRSAPKPTPGGAKWSDDPPGSILIRQVGLLTP